MVERSTPGRIAAEQLRYMASEGVAESFILFFDHLRASVALGAYGFPVEELPARVQEAGLPATLQELARGDARLPWDTEVVDNEAIREWLTQADRATMARYVHQALSRILRGRFTKITQFAIGQSTRFAALTPWLASLGETDEHAAQERAVNARAIIAFQSELEVIALTVASWACAADASALAPERAQRLRRAWSALAGTIRFEYEILPSVCDQVASAYIVYRDLSERLAQAIVQQM